MKYSGVAYGCASQCHCLLADAADTAATQEGVVVVVGVALLVRGHPRLAHLRVAQPLDVLAPLVSGVLRNHTLT